MNNQETLFPMPIKNQPESQKISHSGKPKLLLPTRNQVEMHFSALNELIDEDHPVRQIWSYVDSLDFTNTFKNIQSMEGGVGRPVIDPKIMVALWIYATIEGIGSARVLARYTKEHLAFKWICGNVSIERKSISDFRTNNDELFNEILAQGIAILVKAKMVNFEEISQDGLRVRAYAGRNSFKKEKTVQELYEAAKERIKSLRKELDEEPNNCSQRQREGKLKAAEEKLKRMQEVKRELNKSIEETNKNRINNRKKKLTIDEKNKIKISTTDPEARIMKMPDNGFRPAYNFQFAVDTKSRVVVGVDVVNAGTDSGQMLAMYEQIKEKHKKAPLRYLVDGGFKRKKDIEKLSEEGCEVYMPVQVNANGKKIKNIDQPQAGDSEHIANWRIRMSKKESKEIYRKRASTAEYVNACARNRNLYQIVVQGLKKAKGIAILYSIVHNMSRSIALGIV